MVKKLFALASVTALTGLMAAVAASGCSSTTTVDATPTPEAGPDAKTPLKEAGPDPDPDPEETGPATCPTPTPVTEADIGLTWLAPGTPQSVCGQADLDALKALFAAGKGSAKYSEIEKALSATCGPCVFTAKAGPRWGVIIKDGAQIAADNSQGACFGVLATAECGKARFNIDSCLDIACPRQECGSDATAFRACNTKALKGACKSFVAPYTTACPDEESLIKNCNSFTRVIEVVCGGGADGGLDSGI